MHRMVFASLSWLCALILLLIVWSQPALATANANALLIRGIVINGLKRTQPRTVLRELPFKKGDSWQSSYAEESERRLRNLGLFSEVNVSPPDTNGLVHIRVKERWAIWLLPEVSRHDNGDTNAGITFTDYNLWGLKHNLRLAFRRDTGKNFSGGNTGKSYQASYQWYRIADSKWTMNLYGTRGTQIFDAYSGGALQSQYLNKVDTTGVLLNYAFGPVPSQGTTASVGYDSTVTTYDLVNGSAQSDVLGQRRHALLLGISYQWLDDRITWLKGRRMGYNINIAHKAFGSSIQAVRQTAYFRDYHELSGEKTLNIRLDGGIATGDVLRDGLFDIGGGSGVRGYIGGELQGSAYLEGGIETRIPIQDNSNLQWVAFTDMGWLARKAAVSTSKPFAIGTGTGIRWTLRWLVHGTIRADVAYGWATRKWRFYLGTGQSF